MQRSKLIILSKPIKMGKLGLIANLILFGNRMTIDKFYSRFGTRFYENLIKSKPTMNLTKS